MILKCLGEDIQWRTIWNMVISMVFPLSASEYVWYQILYFVVSNSVNILLTFFNDLNMYSLFQQFG